MITNNIFQQLSVISIIVGLTVFMVGCGSPTNSENENGVIHYDKSDIYDNTIDGAHIILLYENSSKTFIGTIANESSETLIDVSIKIHLSNGVTLGPFTAKTIEESEIKELRLYASDTNFTAWAVEVEIG